MNTASQKVNIFFSDRKVTFAILFVVIAARILQLIFYYNIRVDGMYQVVAMQNFVYGHGISIGNVLPGDLSIVQYEPLINWPPGYSIILALFYLLFNHNYILAGILMDIFFAILLIFTCRRILKLLETPLSLINIYTLLTGFFIYYFYFIDSSDSIAISIIMIAIYFTLKLIKNNRFTFKTATGIIIPLFLSGFIKYLFIPVTFIIPLYLFFIGVVNKKNVYKKAGIINFLILSLLFLGLLFYQKQISGTAFYISQPTRGFYPENLVSAYPAIPASFIKPETIGFLKPGNPSLENLIFRIFQFMNLLFITGFIILILKKLLKRKFSDITSSDSLIYISFLLLLAITLLLAILSLTVAKEENIPGNLWTYIEEPRYYGLFNVLIHLSVFTWSAYLKKFISSFNKYILYILLLLMLPEAIRGLLFTSRRVLNLDKEVYIWQLEHKLQLFADEIIQNELGKNPAENIVVTGSMYYLNYRVSIYSHTAIMNKSSVLNNLPLLKTNKPSFLLIIIYEKDLPHFKTFILSDKKEFAGYKDGFYYYTTHVNPN